MNNEDESERTVPNVLYGNFPLKSEEAKLESVLKVPQLLLTNFVDDKDFVGNMVSELARLEVNTWPSLAYEERQSRLGQYIETIKLLGAHFSIPTTEKNNFQRFEDIIFFYDRFMEDSKSFSTNERAKVSFLLKETIRLKKI